MVFWIRNGNCTKLATQFNWHGPQECGDGDMGGGAFDGHKYMQVTGIHSYTCPKGACM